MRKARRISHIQREKLEEIGIKKRGFLKLSVGCKAILKALDEEGPLTRGQIMKVTKIPKGTIDRYLGLLKELGCVERFRKKYVRYSDITIFENRTDRDLALDHSRNVASGLKFLIGVGRYVAVGQEELLKPKEEYREHALEHLKTSQEYREIYNLFEEADKARKKASEEECRFREGIKVKLLLAKLKLVDEAAEIVASEVYKDIKKVLRNGEPHFLNNLKVEEGKVKSGVNTLAEEAQFESLRKFILKEEKLEENINACKRMLSFENCYNTLRQDFEKHANQLIMQVLNGTPLKGKCNPCPKVMTLSPSSVIRAHTSGGKDTE